MVPRSATAITDTALGMPLAVRVVPSIGSTATSPSGPLPLPTRSPLYSIGASSFSPSPMTTTPFMSTVVISARIALTAARSAPFLSPRPIQRPRGHRGGLGDADQLEREVAVGRLPVHLEVGGQVLCSDIAEFPSSRQRWLGADSSQATGWGRAEGVRDDTGVSTQSPRQVPTPPARSPT